MNITKPTFCSGYLTITIAPDTLWDPSKLRFVERWFLHWKVCSCSGQTVTKRSLIRRAPSGWMFELYWWFFFSAFERTSFSSIFWKCGNGTLPFSNDTQGKRVTRVGGWAGTHENPCCLKQRWISSTNHLAWQCAAETSANSEKKSRLIGRVSPFSGLTPAALCEPWAEQV